MKQVLIFGGQGSGGVMVAITGQMPDVEPGRLRAFFASEGAALAEAIWNYCPGGTVDALLVALLQRRSVLLQVTMPRDAS